MDNCSRKCYNTPALRLSVVPHKFVVPAYQLLLTGSDPKRALAKKIGALEIHKVVGEEELQSVKLCSADTAFSYFFNELQNHPCKVWVSERVDGNGKSLSKSLIIELVADEEGITAHKELVAEFGQVVNDNVKSKNGVMGTLVVYQNTDEPPFAVAYHGPDHKSKK